MPAAELQEQLLLGISPELFARGAQTFAGSLLVVAVHYLARIALGVRAINRRSHRHQKRLGRHHRRLKKLETSVFSSSMSPG